MEASETCGDGVDHGESRKAWPATARYNFASDSCNDQKGALNYVFAKADWNEKCSRTCCNGTCLTLKKGRP